MLLNIVKNSTFEPISFKILNKKTVAEVEMELYSKYLDKYFKQPAPEVKETIIQKTPFKFSTAASTFVPGASFNLKLNSNATSSQPTFTVPTFNEFKTLSNDLRRMYNSELQQYMEPIHVDAITIASVLNRKKKFQSGPIINDSSEVIKLLEQKERRKILESCKSKTKQKKADNGDEKLDDIAVSTKKPKKKKAEINIDDKIAELVELEKAREKLKAKLVNPTQSSLVESLQKKYHQEMLKNQGWSEIHGSMLGNMITPSLVENITLLLTELNRVQEINYQKNPKCKRHFVCGLKQILKLIRAGQIKYVIIARKIDELVDYFPIMLAEAIVNKIPIIFALNRRQLSKILGKTGGKSSAVGVLDGSIGHEYYVNIQNELNAAREKYMMFRNDPFRKIAI